jgi:hypothetical protein
MAKKKTRGPVQKTKWKSGTKSQAANTVGRELKKNPFSADDLCRIIDSCAKQGVKEFSVGGVELRFHDAPPAQQKVLTPDHARNDKEALLHSELLEKEDRVAMMILEDPEEFERQLVAGELEELISDADDGSEAEYPGPG